MTKRRNFLKTSAMASVGVIIAPSGFSGYFEILSGAQQRYPDPSIVILDNRFAKYCQSNASVERLWTGARWAEGPVWFRITGQCIQA